MRRISVSPLALAGGLGCAFAIGVGVTLAALRPGWPGQPAPDVHDPAVLFRAPDASMAAGSGTMAAPNGSATADATAPASLPDVDTMIARVRDRLARDPSDADGWMMLGWSYANTGRLAEAVPAYARAADLRPDNPEVLGQYGAAMVALAGGRIEAGAADVFDRVLRLAPGDARGLYYAGLIRLQDGDAAGGEDLLKQALAAAPPDAPWLADLRARLGAKAP